MVRIVAPADYDEEKDKPDQPWATIVSEALKEFLTAIGESSKQLSTAAERFAAGSLRLIDEANEKAQQSAAASSEAAATANRASEEATRAAESIARAAEEVGERLREEARQTLESSLARVDEALEVGERLKIETQQRADEMVARIERGAGAYDEAVKGAEQAAAEAREAASRIESTVNASQEAATSAQQAAAEAREAASRIESTVNASQEAVTRAEQAAAEAREHAARVAEVEASPAISAAADDILRRLEEDYQLLTDLVQELHSRIANLSVQAPPFEPEAPTAEEPEEAFIAAQMQAEPGAWREADLWAAQPPAVVPPAAEEAPSPAEWPAEAPAATDTEWEAYVAPSPAIEPEAAHAAEAEAPSSEAEPAAIESSPAEPEPADVPEEGAIVGEPSDVRLDAGQFIVRISPVPDFDRLLNLDGALGRMGNVSNVSLADYAGEEVTFRLEIHMPESAAEFARELAACSGLAIEVAGAAADSLSLRVV